MENHIVCENCEQETCECVEPSMNIDKEIDELLNKVEYGDIDHNSDIQAIFPKKLTKKDILQFIKDIRKRDIESEIEELEKVKDDVINDHEYYKQKRIVCQTKGINSILNQLQRLKAKLKDI